MNQQLIQWLISIRDIPLPPKANRCAAYKMSFSCSKVDCENCLLCKSPGDYIVQFNNLLDQIYEP